MPNSDSTLFNPPRPWPIRLFNKLGPKVSLDPETLIHKAEKRTGLGLKDETLNRTAFNLLLKCMDEEAHMHKFGRWLFRERLKGILDNRLRLAWFLKKYPEILDQKIEAPIIITGMQRTGTTLLQRLLNQDPNHRALLSWEALSPIPNPLSRKDNRIRTAKIGQKLVKYMAPQFFAIHPIEYLAPEEEVLLHEASLISTVPEATHHVPTYAKYVESADHTPSYTLLKQILQFLQWKNPGKRWILKTPQHLEFLHLVKATFPDALVVMTHRDPQKVVPSFSSMIYHSRRVFSDQVDPAECATHWLRKNGSVMQKAIHFRDQNPDLKVIDIAYNDLVKDPLNTLRQIYAAHNIQLTDPTTQKMQAFLQSNQQHRYGKHLYRMEDFGLSQEKIDFYFAGYRERFGVGRE